MSVSRAVHKNQMKTTSDILRNAFYKKIQHNQKIPHFNIKLYGILLFLEFYAYGLVECHC
jgi:hypothetical protein